MVLCLGVLGFSASKTSREVAKKVDTVPGFEKLIWGMSKDEVINKLGEPKFNFDKILTYENLEFIGLNVEVDFYFKEKILRVAQLLRIFLNSSFLLS